MKTKKLITSSVMIALASVLSLYSVYRLPTGGSVTPASMVPVIMLSYLYGTKHGTFAALVYALLQGVLGFYAPPVQNAVSFAIVILFDYAFAFAVLGLADMFRKIFGSGKFSIAFSGGAVVFLRFLCHLVSGVTIWSVYAPEGQSPFLYSLLYNGSYMLPELVITVIALVAVSGVIERVKTERD